MRPPEHDPLIPLHVNVINGWPPMESGATDQPLKKGLTPLPNGSIHFHNADMYPHKGAALGNLMV